MTGRIVLSAVVCTIVSCAAVYATDERQQAVATSDDGRALTRFLNTPDAVLTSYRALRTLEAETRGGKMRARMTARTSLDPVHGFQYSVVEEEGSEIIRRKVLRAALDAEVSLRSSNGEMDKGALTAGNYAFAPAGTDGAFVRVSIHPKRLDTMLVEGHILLTETDADLVRIEGHLIKRPSLWTRRVDIVRRYERIAGYRVPVAMQSVARVLVVGTSTFSMTYTYESINGTTISAAQSSALSSCSCPQRSVPSPTDRRARESS
jgi:hypothetical protein